MGTIAISAQLACTDIYEPVSATFDKVYRVGSTVCGTKLVDSTLYVVFQGTDTEQGWEEDFHALPSYHPTLGNLHSGFYKNLPGVIEQLSRDIRTGLSLLPDLVITVTGHSKGAGEGSLAGPLLKLAGFNVGSMILFACPNSGYQRLADWIAQNIPGSLSFRNAPKGSQEFGDPVPLLPVIPYVPPVAHTMIDEPPTGFAACLGLIWHEAALYQAGATDWESAR